MVTVSPGAPDIVLKETVESAANAATGVSVARAVATRTPPIVRAMRFLVMCGFLLSWGKRRLSQIWLSLCQRTEQCLGMQGCRRVCMTKAPIPPGGWGGGFDEELQFR
jgi:hypothetical protein